MHAHLAAFTGSGLSALQNAALALLGMPNRRQLLPRQQCHYVSLSAKGLPARYAASALRLQLIQQGFALQPGFAFRIQGEQAQVWYWEERGRVTAGAQGGVILQPEPLLRPVSAPGLRILRCTPGFEAEYRSADGSLKTRWFAQEPDAAQWIEFCRDAGVAPPPQPAPQVQVLAARLPRGWQTDSRLTRALPAWAWLAGLGGLALGCVLVNLAVQSYKLDDEIARTEAKLVAYKQTRAQSAAEQAQIEKLSRIVGSLKALRPAHTQLELLRSLADSGVIGRNAADVTVTNWNYQNGHLNLSLYVGRTTLSNSEVVARLEKRPEFRKLQLSPDAASGFLIVQTTVEGPPVQGFEAAPATAAGFAQ